MTLCFSAGSTWAVELVAHRGASHLAPENTLAAIELGWLQGADAVEIDVWLTRDGRIVALHDETTKRTAGRDWKVSKRTFDELRTLDAGSWKGETYAGEKIPALEEILATVPKGKRLFIEVKCSTAILPELDRVLRASDRLPAQTVIISFDYELAREAKRRMPDRPVLWVHGRSPRRDKKTGRATSLPDELIDKCRQAGLDGLDLNYESELTPRIVERMHALGLELHVWTVNAPQEARRLIELGVDGITTDRPGWLRRQLETQ